jgi:hypothetical protein
VKTLPPIIDRRELSRPVNSADRKLFAAESCGSRCVCRGSGTITVIAGGRRFEKQCERAVTFLAQQCGARLIAIDGNLWWRAGCDPVQWPATQRSIAALAAERARWIASLEADRTRNAIASLFTSWAEAINRPAREAAEEDRVLRELSDEVERRAA